LCAWSSMRATSCMPCPKPGTHNHKSLESNEYRGYGFRAPSLRSGPGMTLRIAESVSSMRATSCMASRTPDRGVHSAIAQSGVQGKKLPRNGSVSCSKAGSRICAVRFARHRSSRTRVCAPSSMRANVIYGGQRHLWACVAGRGSAGVVRFRRDPPVAPAASAPGRARPR
jgi:hypothetical protein